MRYWLVVRVLGFHVPHEVLERAVATGADAIFYPVQLAIGLLQLVLCPGKVLSQPKVIVPLLIQGFLLLF